MYSAVDCLAVGVKISFCVGLQLEYKSNLVKMHPSRRTHKLTKHKHKNNKRSGALKQKLRHQTSSSNLGESRWKLSQKFSQMRTRSGQKCSL